MINLRDYQRQAKQCSLDAFDRGIQRQAMSICTGGGKTVLFCDIINSRQRRALIIAPRQELIKQAARKMFEMDKTLQIGMAYSGHRPNDYCDVVVGSPQTLGTDRGKKLLDQLGEFGTVILDEFHHSFAQTYTSILEHQGFPCDGSLSAPSGKLMLGVTATLGRTDGEPLGHIAEEVVYSYGIRDAIEDGYLVDIKPFRIVSNTSLDGLQIKRGASGTDGKDYLEKELAKRIINEERNDLIVNAYLQHAKGKKTIVFCVNLEHVAALTIKFQRAGVRVEGLTKDVTDRERQAILTRFESGDTDVLINCMVLTEGYDCPGVECVIMARPTKSQLIYIQQLGRGLRLLCDINGVEDSKERLERIAASRKPYLLLLDIVDNCSKNSPVMLPVLFGLNPNLELRGKTMFKAVKEVEEAKANAPRLRIDELTDISELKSVEAKALKINIWDGIEVTPEIKKNSDLSWYRDSSDEYFIPVASHETLGIRQNTLGQYEVFLETSHSYNETTGLYEPAPLKRETLGHSDKLSDLLKRSDVWIKENYPDQINLLKHSARWKNDPASKDQIALLNKTFKIPIYTADGRSYVLGYDWIDNPKKPGKKKPVPRCASGQPHYRKDGEYLPLTKGIATAISIQRFQSKKAA